MKLKVKVAIQPKNSLIRLKIDGGMVLMWVFRLKIGPGVIMTLLA